MGETGREKCSMAERIDDRSGLSLKPKSLNLIHKDLKAPEGFRD